MPWRRMGEVWYNSARSWPRHLLIPRPATRNSIYEKVPQPLWKSWRRQNSFAPPGIKSHPLGCPAISLLISRVNIAFFLQSVIIVTFLLPSACLMQTMSRRCQWAVKEIACSATQDTFSAFQCFKLELVWGHLVTYVTGRISQLAGPGVERFCSKRCKHFGF